MSTHGGIVKQRSNSTTFCSKAFWLSREISEKVAILRFFPLLKFEEFINENKR